MQKFYAMSHFKWIHFYDNLRLYSLEAVLLYPEEQVVYNNTG